MNTRVAQMNLMSNGRKPLVWQDKVAVSVGYTGAEGCAIQTLDINVHTVPCGGNDGQIVAMRQHTARRVSEPILVVAAD